MAPQPALMPVAQPGQVVPLTRMRKAIAEHMVQSKRTSPHVTSVFEADLSAIVAHREANKDGFAANGLRLTYMPYFVEAVAHALQKHPMVNSSFVEDGILIRPAINIGIAAAVEGGQGLIVPVIKNADQLSLRGLARAIGELTERARNGTLTPDDVSGGTFTITNHGVSGSLWGTPIINQPQAGILGIGKIQKRVVVTQDDAIAIRPMVYVSFTFDHRILDGASADAFVADVIDHLESYAR
ncbi:MAG: 2-oxo acid dehydrogenase subunit E2 [Ardenticatenaceae bacterium]|nr:2-oxo acid dehydrogenase subunit E2 [Ardenticatenaceae bacterium]